jgi:hypothetical protein
LQPIGLWDFNEHEEDEDEETEEPDTLDQDMVRERLEAAVRPTDRPSYAAQDEAEAWLREIDRQGLCVGADGRVRRRRSGDPLVHPSAVSSSAAQALDDLDPEDDFPDEEALPPARGGRRTSSLARKIKL